MSDGPISRYLCLVKARECRELALEAATKPARIMLTHIAETWERTGELVPGSSLDAKA